MIMPGVCSTMTHGSRASESVELFLVKLVETDVERGRRPGSSR